MGVKCASLFCVKNIEKKDITYLVNLRKKGLDYTVFTNRKGCHLLFLYRPIELEKRINGPEERDLLSLFGYDTSSLCLSLEHLGERLKEEEFPHEIGVFLGYPIDDVKSFISQKGQNYILSGIWKVYHNEEKSRHTFHLYEECTMRLLEQYEKGYTLENLCV